MGGSTLTLTSMLMMKTRKLFIKFFMEHVILSPAYLRHIHLSM